MTDLLKRAFVTVLGIAVVLAYWSFTGDDGASKTSEGIPAKVWDGGAAILTVAVETTTPARFSVTFGERVKEDGRSLETWTKIPAGSKSWSINVPARVGGYIDLGAEDPKVGDRLAWKIEVDGRVVDEQTEALEEELKPNYAFGLQAYFEDYSKGEFGDD